MQLSSIPAKFQIPFANNAGAPYIRTVPILSQIGINPGFASFTDGFVPLNMTPVASGGIPPFGQDMNGILKAITQWLQWAQANSGYIPLDYAFQSQIGGYPQNALVGSLIVPNRVYQSLVDNNLSDPDNFGDNWITFGDGQRNDVKWLPSGLTVVGWIKLNATTIGSPSSGASQLAASAALNAYSYFWTNFSNTQCPVSGGRGGSATADFNANKTIATFDMRGYVPVGSDTMGGSVTTRLSGVPVSSGAANLPGSLLGEALHTLVTGELASHNHGITDPTHTHTTTAGGSQFLSGTGGNFSPNFSATTTGASATGITINNTGSGTAHNTTQLSITGTWYLKY